MMGFFYILPILIYYFIVRYFINKYFREDENKLYHNIKGFSEKRKFEKENERNTTFKKEKQKLFVKKTLLMIVFVSMPFWDGIFYYTCIKYTSLTNPGIIVYKKVTDIQEQRDYWFLLGLYHRTDYYYRHDKIPLNYITFDLLFSSDFRNIYNIYYPKFYSNDKDINKEKEIEKLAILFHKVKKSEYSLFFMDDEIIKINKTPNFVRKTERGNYKVEESNLFFMKVVDKYNKEIVDGYKNYCKEYSFNLSIDSEEYKSSCHYADKLIRKYNLKNVIRVPARKYINNTKKEYIYKPLEFYKTIEYVKNIETNEIYGEKITYFIKKGWYTSLWAKSFFQTDEPIVSKEYGYTPNQYKKNINHLILEEIVIPNPYRKEK